MYTHPDFWKYLRYFVLGARLSDSIERQFFRVQRDPFRGPGDLVRLAKRQAGRIPIDGRKLAEEFYKLALDCDCEPYEALRVRRAVLAMRA